MRERAADQRGLTLAVKGGHDGENHNHLDVGSFVVATDGVPVVVDVGRPTYTAVTFSPDRYTLWPLQSSWHNVPEGAGVQQGVGARFAARRTTRLDDGLTLDLAPAYPVPGLSTWERSARLRTDDDGPYVEILDAWEGTALDGTTIYGQWLTLDATEPGLLTFSGQTRVMVGTAP